jgi:pimeloyl-ACP methyl ester carboxylesterase
MALPLVLVPGLMCDGATWAPLLPALQGSGQVGSLLLVDHGLCDSLLGMAEQLLADAPPRFALAGHSMGGRVALEVCRLAPERVSHLALLDTGHAPLADGEAGQVEAQKRQVLLDIARTQGVRAMAAQWVQGMVHPERLSEQTLIDAILDMFERKSADDFERQIRALLGRPDGAPVLRGLRVPTLILTGRQDSWANVEQHRAMQALAAPEAGAVLEVVEDSGHMVPMERPAELAHALLRWLAR